MTATDITVRDYERIARPDAIPHHRLPRVRPDRDRDRADRDPLVCAGLYRRHRAGLDLCARADQERAAVGRAGADFAGADRRLHPLGHASASSSAAAPAMCCSTILPFFIAASRRDLRAVEGRHVVPRRLPRLRRRGDAVCPHATASRSCRSATSPPRSGRSACSSAASPISSTASCGAGPPTPACPGR